MGKLSKILGATALALSLQAAVAVSADAKGGMTSGYAVVAPDGKLSRGKNVMAVKHISAGVYQVNFTDDTSKCAFAGTIAGDRDTLLPGYLVVSHTNAPSKTVNVFTFATVTLLPADFRFHLLVSC
jgi:hypothetical protein